MEVPNLLWEICLSEICNLVILNSGKNVHPDNCKTLLFVIKKSFQNRAEYFLIFVTFLYWPFFINISGHTGYRKSEKTNYSVKSWSRSFDRAQNRPN
jgi:hypothetical protein